MDKVCKLLNEEDSDKFTRGTYDIKKVFGKHIVIERYKRRIQRRKSKKKIKFKRKLTLGEQLEIKRSQKRLSASPSQQSSPGIPESPYP